MNKLDLQAQGLTFSVEDFRFEQNAVRKMLEMLGWAFANPFVPAFNQSAISVGVMPKMLSYQSNATDVVLYGGIAVVYGEMCEIKIDTYSSAGLKFYWDIEETVDTAGDQNLILNPSTQVSLWKIRKAILVPYTGSLPAGKVKFGDEYSMADVLHDVLNTSNEDWQNANIIGSWSNYNASATKFRKTWDGYLECWFFVGKYASGADNVFQLPGGYIPNRPHLVTVFRETVDAQVMFKVDTDGYFKRVSGDPLAGGTNGSPNVGWQGYFKVPLVI
jgi:hypothetical protein